MPRSPRMDFPGALHHATARGNRGQNIFQDAQDSEAFLRLLGECSARFGWQILSFCLMPDRYHLAIETPDGGLARGMRHLNGTYTQRMNRKYETRGHLFDGRYKAVLMEQEAFLRDLIRYIALAPVRAGLTDRAEIWRWSSYRECLAEHREQETGCLARARVLTFFGENASDARQALRAFVNAGANQTDKVEAFEKDLKCKAVLGSKAYVETVSSLLGGEGQGHRAPVSQLAISDFLQVSEDRNEAMAKAYLEGGHTLRVIADAFGVHESTVSRAVAKNAVMQ